VTIRQFKLQTGAVWAEFIVSASFLLVGFFLMVPLLAKVVDVRQKTELASRYTTWERTVWFQSAPDYHPNQDLEKTNEEIQNELHHRVFSVKDSPIDSRLNRGSTNDVDYDPFLNFHNQSTEQYELILPPSNRELVELQQFESGPPGNFSGTLTQAQSLLNVVTFGGFPINDRAYYTGEVTTPLKSFDWIDEFNGIQPELRSSGAILTDAWNTDLELAEQRGTAFMFREPLENIGVTTVLDGVQGILGVVLRDLDNSNLKFFETDVNAVPDRNRAEIQDN